ncbi:MULTISPECIES: ABC transporter permease [unclassified Fibrobacter]|uniref:ABC transporter permease n=1 Tax=unclassified Fibrobacter TaxID=2634177 RepID=UPI000D6AA459|nr:MULTISPECIES: ABC transporter permease [unclassified Fibrobacter]PWJ64069.1 ABC-type transport system involved in multi-copper enzyme maturation permease subunit [Fibrobacter sp. UWR4]PZW69194.1 ABC-type transport system involved in multi-copper enzyme maturation permease subunit [Fibrobacter sp. UWR1]
MQTLNHIFVIALNTFRESIRDKILYNIGFFAVALALFSIVLGEWSVFDRAYVIKSTTLSIMSLSGLLISIFVGISLVQKEIQRRTVLTLLSKPITRAAFIVGKYFGLLAVVAVHLVLLTVIFYLTLLVTGSDPTASLLIAVYLIFCEMAVVIAVALLFSSFSSTVLSALFTLGVYMAGHLSNQLLEQVRFAARMGEMDASSSALFEKAAVAIHAVFPGLYRYNVTSYVVHGVALPDMYLFWNTVYALGYVGVFLAIASWWFSRRDFL